MAHGEFPSKYARSEVTGIDGQPYVERNTYGKGGTFRIVKEKRGDLVTGFHVQIETYGRRGARTVSGLAVQSEYGPYWRNIGRKAYSLEEARRFRNLYEEFMGQRGDRSIEVIE